MDEDRVSLLGKSSASQAKAATPILARRLCITTLLVIAAMLLSAGIAAFFLFPRSPDVVLQSFVPCNVSLNAQNQLSLDLTLDVMVSNPNYALLRLETLNVSLLYEDYLLGVVNAANLAFARRSRKHAPMSAHLYAASPPVALAISAQLTLHGYFPVNYTGTALVTYLGISVEIDLNGTKNATLALT